MLVLRATDAKKRQQWEKSSGTPNASQSNNCGPTCITFIAGFYRDDYNIGIEPTRRAITGCCAPTNSAQQTEMLIARGVPAASIWIDALSQLDNIVTGGTHPIVIGVQMSRVPASVRDHPFLGWHALVVMDTAIKDGIPGYWIMDPNFSPPGGYRPDPDHGKKFYSRRIMEYAYIQNSIRRGIAPLKAKQTNTVGGLPVTNWRSEAGKKVSIKRNKPMRAAAHLGARSYGNTGDSKKTLRLWGHVTDGQAVDGSRKWFFGPMFINKRNRVVYIPDADAFEYEDA